MHRSLLRELQESRCFYCDREIRRGGDIDHFIPWRRYSLELGHNFVLAHQGCNSSKSDLLAAEEHLERWAERSLIHREELETGFGERDVLHDWPATRSIASLGLRPGAEGGGTGVGRKGGIEAALRGLAADPPGGRVPTMTDPAGAE